MRTLKSFRGVPQELVDKAVEAATEEGFRKGRKTGLLFGIPGGAAAGGAAGLAAGAPVAAGAYLYGKKRGEKKGRFENQRTNYYAQQYSRGRGGRYDLANPETEPTWSTSKRAFDQKMLAAMIAGGQNIEKVAEAFEEELEKIANIFARGLGGAIRAGRSMLGMSPSRAAAQRLARMTPQQTAAQARLGVSPAVTGGSQLTGSARQKAMKEFRQLPAPGPKGPQYSGTPQEVAAQRLQRMNQPAPRRQLATGPAAGAGGAPVGGVPATTTPPAAAGAGSFMDDAKALAQRGYQGGVDAINRNLNMGIGTGQGALKGQGLGQWFGSLPVGTQAGLLGTAGVGGLTAAGLGAAGVGAAGLGTLGTGMLIGRATA
jgi:hypothetical protein